jgi:acetyl-CoA C-acetyltransferase
MTSAPVVVGAAQVVQRPGERDLNEALGHIELMVEAARGAAEDAGAEGLLAKVQWIGVAGGWFDYRNPGQLVADAIGAPDARGALTPISGSAPQELLGVAAQRIADGELDVALVVGGEAAWSLQRLRKAGVDPHWETRPGDGDAEMLSPYPIELVHESMALGAAPAYALLDDSRRAARGESLAGHLARISTLWAGFSEVAVTNPAAWDRQRHSAEEIASPSADNRMISFPYTKAMVANNTVDMASAVLLCSASTARAAGISTDRWVFPQVVANSHETWLLAERDQLHGCPALTTAATAALTHAGIGIDEVQHVDLYACFPAVVQMTCDALNLSLDRPLSVTGGLGFAGAAVGNAAGQSIAAMVSLVRAGGIGLVHGNGGVATKHSFALYAAEAPAARAFALIDSQPDVEHRRRAAASNSWAGACTIEAATVVHDRNGPTHVLAAVLTPDGARGWARSTDAAVMDAVSADGVAGRPATRTVAGALHVED